MIAASKNVSLYARITSYEDDNKLKAVCFELGYLYSTSFLRGEKWVRLNEILPGHIEAVIVKAKELGVSLHRVSPFQVFKVPDEFWEDAHLEMQETRFKPLMENLMRIIRKEN